MKTLTDDGAANLVAAMLEFAALHDDGYWDHGPIGHLTDGTIVFTVHGQEVRVVVSVHSPDSHPPDGHDLNGSDIP